MTPSRTSLRGGRRRDRKGWLDISRSLSLIIRASSRLAAVPGEELTGFVDGVRGQVVTA